MGLFAIKSAYLPVAERAIALDTYPERLEMAVEMCRPYALNYEKVNVVESSSS